MATNVKRLSDMQIKAEDQNQTAVVISGTRVDLHNQEPQYRVVFGNWQSREEAWAFCKNNNVRRMVRDGKEKGSTYLIEVKLLKLKKVVRDYSNVEWMKVVA